MAKMYRVIQFKKMNQLVKENVDMITD